MTLSFVFTMASRNAKEGQTGESDPPLEALKITKGQLLEKIHFIVQSNQSEWGFPKGCVGVLLP